MTDHWIMNVDWNIFRQINWKIFLKIRIVGSRQFVFDMCILNWINIFLLVFKWLFLMVIFGIMVVSFWHRLIFLMISMIFTVFIILKCRRRNTSHLWYYWPVFRIFFIKSGPLSISITILKLNILRKKLLKTIWIHFYWILLYHKIHLFSQSKNTFSYSFL